MAVKSKYVRESVRVDMEVVVVVRAATLVALVSLFTELAYALEEEEVVSRSDKHPPVNELRRNSTSVMW